MGIFTCIGLPTQVSNSWWKGYKKDDDRLNAGTIVSVDFDAPQLNYFQLECIGEIYSMCNMMRSTSYADAEHADYDKFMLPRIAPANLAKLGQGDCVRPKKVNQKCNVEIGQ